MDMARLDRPRPDTAVPAIPDGSAALLRDLATGLRRAAAPIEPTLMAVGAALGESLTLLNGIGDDFRCLSALIESQDGIDAVAALTQARQGTLGLTGNAKRTLTGLTALDAEGATMAALLNALSRVIGEITALAINAKVQAAQIRSTTDDFTVFTQEIDRLHRLANGTTQRAADRLAGLRSAIAAACAAATGFHRDNRGDLDDIGSRLKGSLDELMVRRNTARDAARRFAARAAEIGTRITRCIHDLQVGDVTNQRVEHIGHALDLMRVMTGDAPPSVVPGDNAWLTGIDPARRPALLATVCALQTRQCAETSRDFTAQMESLKGNLAALAQDAETIAAEARRMFSDAEADDHSFIRDVAAGVDRAILLLDRYCGADDAIRAQIVQVTEGFAAMTRDVAAIHSIDTDMRLMGLNTTLKCARLGVAGKALGVVAQELRACSRRTEEHSRSIALAIKSAAAHATDLDQHSAANHRAATELASGMMESMAALRKLEAEQQKTLGSLTSACHQASARLSGTVARLTVDGELDAFGRSLAGRLAPLAGLLPDATRADGVEDDLTRLFKDRYTADSERRVHGGAALGWIGATGSGDDGGEINVFF